MEEKHLQMSESFFLTAILAIVGGFLDSYSYLMRGHVFANAQTGNIVLFGVNLQKRDFTQAFYYFVPILAFAVGVILVEIIKHFYKEEHKIHWRQRIVALEFVLITVVAVSYTHLLTDDEKRKVAEIAKEVKPDFIKTSTGFGTGGATVEDVKLMKSVVGDEVKVKAAGGIRDLKTALAMIEAGAERLGTSAGVAIVEEYNNQK